MESTNLNNTSHSRKHTTFKMCKPVRDNRSQIFYVRVAIPENLRSIIGKRELKKLLRTKDNCEALLRFPSVYQHFLDIIELAKKQLFTDNNLSISSDSENYSQLVDELAGTVEDFKQPLDHNKIVITQDEPKRSYSVVNESMLSETEYKLSAYFERYKTTQIEMSEGSIDAVMRTGLNSNTTMIKLTMLISWRFLYMT
jgi:hypothetical protein